MNYLNGGGMRMTDTREPNTPGNLDRTNSSISSRVRQMDASDDVQDEKSASACQSGSQSSGVEGDTDARITWKNPEVALVLSAALQCSLLEREEWGSPLDEANVDAITDRWYALVEALGLEPANSEIKDALLVHARTTLAFMW